MQIMVPGKTNVSLTLSWSTDYDPVAAAQQPGAAKPGTKGDADSEVMPFARQHQHFQCSRFICITLRRSVCACVHTKIHNIVLAI